MASWRWVCVLEKHHRGRLGADEYKRPQGRWRQRRAQKGDGKNMCGGDDFLSLGCMSDGSRGSGGNRESPDGAVGTFFGPPGRNR